MMPAVSVILPTCDRPDLWPRALASVLRQSWADLEVVLIDSNRRTPPISSKPEWAGLLADPRVVLVARPHAPCAAAARNLGLTVARGEWVTYLDDDDEYHPDKVANLGPEFVKVAEERFKSIQQAYEEIRREKGF